LIPVTPKASSCIAALPTIRQRPEASKASTTAALASAGPASAKTALPLTGRQTGNVDAILDRSGQGAFAKFE
jgi:hypothetical protein